MAGKYTEIRYYKIKYALSPTWLLWEAAALMIGEEPNPDIHNEDPNGKGSFNRMFYFLKNHVGEQKNISPDFIFDVLTKNNMDHDNEIKRVREWAYTPHKDGDNEKTDKLGGAVRRAIYRAAADIIRILNSDATNKKLSKLLVELPEKYSRKYKIDKVKIAATEDQILDLLKGTSAVSVGKPKADDGDEYAPDWFKVMSKL